MDHVIEAVNLQKIYPNGIKAIDGLSFSVNRGGVFGLLGVNGAGKTTTIRILTTLIMPTSGSVKVLGLDAQKNQARIKERLGVVPQENNLDNRLTVEQNLVFHGRYFGLKKAEAGKRAKEWMHFLELEDKAGEMVYHLSGGTKRKVMLAKAFITDPELLILDEPTSGLDPKVRMLIWEKILAFRNSGKTVLLSTHYLEEAERLCDGIGIVHRGRMASVTDTSGNKISGTEAFFHSIAGGKE